MRSSFISRFVANDTMDVGDDGDDDDLYCAPNSSWNFTETCDYIQNTDACAGGGYIEWTTLVLCCEDEVAKWFVVAGGVLFLLLLFLMLQSSADDFFSPNLGTIVAHLKMSEGVAGVTFLAFGNGAPDVFGAIASVLSSPKPKADLALGGLIGGAIFVTLCVHAAVVITVPFRCSYYSTMRDLFFLLITTCLILSFFLIGDEIYLWQPLTFLGLYIIYVTLVFINEHFKKRRHEKKLLEEEMAAAETKRNSIMPTIQVEDADDMEKPAVTLSNATHMTVLRRRTTTVGSAVPDHDGYDFVVMHNKVMHRDSIVSRRSSMHSMHQSGNTTKNVVYHLLAFFAIDFGDDESPSTFTKVKAFIFWPLITIFKLTIPLAEAPWSKPLAIIQAVLVPQCLLFNTQFIAFVPIEGGPGLWAYVPIVSILLIIFILLVTEMNEEPRFYKMTYALLGFVTSVLWIYCISAEVVDVVTMLGVVSGIDQAVLGLTLIAWANCMGDLVADITVAKQGFPRMAVAASIGGPLFNLLIGFGVPFTIAKLKGDTVPIQLDGITLIMITFLFISILFTAATVVIFKANLTRMYGVLLLIIYVAFLVFVLLDVTNLLVWLPST